MRKEVKSRLMKGLLTGTLAATIGVGSGVLGSQLQKKENADIIQKYEQTLDAKSDELNYLIEKNNTIEEVNQSLQTENSAIKEENQSLQTENSTFKSQIFNLNEEIYDLSEKVEMLNRFIDYKDNIIESNYYYKLATAYTYRIQELESKIDQLEIELNNSEYTNKKLQYQLDKAKTDLDKTNSNLTTIINENEILKGQLEEKIEYQSAVGVVKTGIDMLRDYIDEKPVHSASDRTDVHHKFDVTYNYIDRLHENKQLNNEQVDALESYLDTLVDSYVYKNISNSVQSYLDSDYFKMEAIISNEHTDTQSTETIVFSKTQAYGYADLSGKGVYAIISDGKSISILDDECIERDINAEDSKKENINGMLSELNNFLNYYGNVTYDSESDSYSILLEYNGEEYLNTATYTFDENGNLSSYTSESDKTSTTSTVEFGTITQVEFDENFAKVNAKVQEEKARIEESQSEQQ